MDQTVTVTARRLLLTVRPLLGIVSDYDDALLGQMPEEERERFRQCLFLVRRAADNLQCALAGEVE